MRRISKGGCQVDKKIFQQIKSAVDMSDVCEMLGLDIKKGFVSCPLHVDKSPSLKINSNFFYCFSCGVSGDVISFVALFYDVPQVEAARKIDEYFKLGLFDGKPKCLPKRKRGGSSQPDYAAWRAESLEFIAWLCRLYRFDLTTQASDWLEGLHQLILEGEPVASWYDFRTVVYLLGRGVEIYGKQYIESRCL